MQELSDEECQKLTIVPRETAKQKKLRLLNVKQSKISRKTLRHLVSSGCGCKCDCFAPFRGQHFEGLVHLREKLQSLAKMQADDHVRV